jgi:adenosylhomocysteine nucleosidase
MEGCAVAQVCFRNNVRFAAVKSVSDHLFFEKQIDEYFDFGQALEKLGEVLLPLAQALTKED